MIFLLDFCDFANLWWLAWILPFILGYLIGMTVWKKYRRLMRELQVELDACRKKSAQLEDDLAECRKAYGSLENENATLRGKIRELEAALAAAKKAAADAEAKLSMDDTVTVEDVPPSSTTAINVDTPKVDVGDIVTGIAATGAGSGDKDLGIYAKIPTDNLQVVEGIGPKMQEVLNKANVHDWAALAAKSPDDLRAILDEYGRKYQIIDPATWSQQAGLAHQGKWDELIALQKTLDTGRTGGSGETDAKVEKILVKMGLLKKYKQDDLKIVEGIGPKIEGLLHAAGIKTWRALADSSVETIQKILDDAGDRYNLADPGTWPKQAELAADGKFKELEEYQDFLQGGKE